MKKVGELKNNSNFNVSFHSAIGESKPQKDDNPEFNTKTLTAIGLHRTDAEYLDEVRFDLTRKRDGIYTVLKKYWESIKTHYDFGKSIISTQETYDPVRIAMYKKGEKYLFSTNSLNNMKVKVHFANPNTIEGFRMYLYVLHKEVNGAYRKETRTKIGLPANRISEKHNSYFPALQIENATMLSYSHRLNWVMGLLEVSDCSVLMALLMMENPSWTISSLIEAKVLDEDGRPILKTSELGMSFEIDKERAKQSKKEILSDLSYEILSFLVEIRKLRRDLIQKGKENYLFLTRSNGEFITLPSKSNLFLFMSGSQENRLFIGSYFPSILNFGIERNTLSHGKLRHTEGVLEWFRTGSIRRVSKVLGNTKRVALEHYIPKPLLTAWSTRQVRRFQNLIIVAATSGEDYQLDAVDFNNLSALNEFLIGILSDETNKSPLLEYLRDCTNVIDKKIKTPLGNLYASISDASLLGLYCYRLAALNSNVEPDSLISKHQGSEFSPMGFINLANHLRVTLPYSKESKLVQMHERAEEKAASMMNKLNWADLFITSGDYLNG